MSPKRKKTVQRGTQTNTPKRQVNVEENLDVFFLDENVPILRNVKNKPRQIIELASTREQWIA